MSAPSLAVLHNLATQLRIDSVRATSEAGSGHPTTCLSAAEIVAALFFAEMRFDPKDPQHPEADRFVLSKGHGAPILYAAWAEAGALPAGRSAEPSQDHVRPRGPSDAAAAVRRRRHRIARPGPRRRDRHGAQRPSHRLRLPDVRAARRRRDARKDRSGKPRRSRANQKLDNLCGDHRRQRPRPEPCDAVGPPPRRVPSRWNAFGWHAIAIDGHDLSAILAALAEARADHGPADDDHRAARSRARACRSARARTAGTAAPSRRVTGALDAPCRSSNRSTSRPADPAPSDSRAAGRGAPRVRCPLSSRAMPAPAYKLGESVATREAYGAALAVARRPRPAHRRARRRRRQLDVQREVRAGASGSLLRDLHRRAGDGRRGDGPGEPRRDSVPVHVRVLPRARRRLHPHGGHLATSTSSSPARTRACRLARTGRRRWRSRTSP